MTSNLINSLCLFSQVLLTVTRDEQQNKHTGPSQSLVEQENPIHDGKYPLIGWGGGEGGLLPTDLDTAPLLCAHKTFIHIVLLTASSWAEWTQAELTPQSGSNSYCVPL